MWIMGVRDWRCHVIAVTSPVVVHGLYFGNLTIVLVLLVALAWRFRQEAPLAGGALGIAIAAKLFVAPLVVWLLLTRRFRAAAWCAATAVVLVLGAWAIVGGEGLRNYPALIRALQDVYATQASPCRLSRIARRGGDSRSRRGRDRGRCRLAVATWLVRRADGDRRAFAAALTACVVGSPIVWPNYAALLFVPIAATWPRLAPAWFFGYTIWLRARAQGAGGGGLLSPARRRRGDLAVDSHGTPALGRERNDRNRDDRGRGDGRRGPRTIELTATFGC